MHQFKWLAAIAALVVCEIRADVSQVGMNAMVSALGSLKAPWAMGSAVHFGCLVVQRVLRTTLNLVPGSQT